jgi:cystathionine beta-lyase/cystathionine gamma-synthase
MRGIKTLKVRLEAQQAGAGILARWLKGHPHVSDVFYPGLEGHPGKDVNEKQAAGAGAVLSFRTKTTEQALRFLGKVEYAAAAVSLGGVETIASYPVRMSHAAMPPEERQRLGITDTLIRLSVGLEDTEDLVTDFDNALR